MRDVTGGRNAHKGLRDRPAHAQVSAALLALALLAGGCAETFAPVLAPVVTDRVKLGRQHETLVVLPNDTLASVHLHYIYISGRLAISRIGIVNHHPGRIELFPNMTRVYVDDGLPLQIASHKEFDPKASKLDAQLLEPLPKGAAGTWLIPQRRFLTRDSLRGPDVVLFYAAEEYTGFAKIRYRAMWDIPG